MGIFERSLLTLAVAGGAFGYGLAVGHWQVFPYEQLMQARRALTGGGAKAQQPRETPPPPPPGLWHRAKTDEAPEAKAASFLSRQTSCPRGVRRHAVPAGR